MSDEPKSPTTPSPEPRPPANGAAPSATRWWLSPTDQTFVACCTAALLGIVIVQYVRLGAFRGELVEIERLPQSRYVFQLEINEANWVEWSQLEGIGELTARKIVSYREEHGPFRALEDLLDVPGIGPKTFEAMRPHLYLRKPETSAEETLRLDVR